MAYGNVNMPGASAADVKAAEAAAQNALDKIGNTSDTGGSPSAGTVMGKLNKIIESSSGSASADTHLIWLNDYKTFGEDSYVFQNKDILHELYEDFSLVIHDMLIRVEALEYADKNNLAGQYLAAAYDISNADSVKNIQTTSALVQNSAAMNVVRQSDVDMKALLDYNASMNALIKSTTAMNSVAASIIGMKAIAESEEAMNTLLASNTLSIVASSATAMNQVAASEVAVDAIVKQNKMDSFLNATSMAAIAASETAMRIISESEEAMTAISQSEVAVDAIAKSSVASNVVCASNNSMGILCNSEIALNNLYTVFFNSTPAMNCICNNESNMAAVAASYDCMQAAVADAAIMQTFSESDICKDAITKSATALQIIAKNADKWESLKPFIIAINNNGIKYVQNAYDILTNTNYFTRKTTSRITQYDTYMEKLHEYCTSEYANNGFIIGHAGVPSNSQTATDPTTIRINNEIVVERAKSFNADGWLKDISKGNVNILLIPTATFTTSNNCYATIAVFISK